MKYDEGTTVEKKNQIIEEVNNQVDLIRKKSTRHKKLISKIPVEKTEAKSAAYAIKIDEGSDKEDVRAALTELKKKNGVTYAHPFFQNQDGTIQAYTNEIIVKLREGTPYDQFSNLLNQVNAKIVSQNQYRPNVFYISTTAETKISPIEVANYLYETNLFEYAEPNFWSTVKNHSSGSFETEGEDPYYTSQWAHTKMKVNEAWTTSGFPGGSSDIKIAILDEGIQYEHPDLKNQLAKDGSGHIIGYDCAGLLGGNTNGIRSLGNPRDVKILGNMVLVSYNNDNSPYLRTVLKFEKKNGTWMHTWTYRNPFQEAACEDFGHSIALSNSFILIGAAQSMGCLGCCKRAGSVLY